MATYGEKHPYDEKCAQRGCHDCFEEWRLRCPCGSGEQKFEIRDGYGIFLTYACEKCEREKLGRFRPDIMSRYEADEPIEPDPDDYRDSRRNGDFDE